MGHPYRIREIAQQSGLSEATVDRVLNGRPGVRQDTAEEVRRAIADLDRQRSQLRLTGRTFLIDLVMHAPSRFTGAVRTALEAELPSLQPATVRARFHLRETGSPADVVATLDKIGAADRAPRPKRRLRSGRESGWQAGSHGVILKAPDVPEVAEAVDRLVERGVQVVTLVTDLPASRRLAYVGIDNRAAGATAAYLVQQWLGERPGDVLVTLSSSVFRGEEERELGFRSAMSAARSAPVGQPPRRLVDITESAGLDDVLRDLAVRALEANPEVVAAYSIGGGNTAIVEAFERLGRRCEVFVAHDLDDDNLPLLRAGRLSAVLRHDLRLDLRNACLAIMRAHRALPGPIAPPTSVIQVVTPFNLPVDLQG